MATSWQEMINLGSREPAKIERPEEAEPEQRRRVFRRLRESLSKSRQALQEEISAAVFDKINDEPGELLEEALILADVGAPTTAAVVEKLEHEVDSGAVPAEGPAIRDRLIEILPEAARGRETRARGRLGRRPRRRPGDPRPADRDARRGRLDRPRQDRPLART